MEVTKHLGFKPGHDEYKVMGLASFGKPTYVEQFRRIVRTQPDVVVTELQAVALEG